MILRDRPRAQAGQQLRAFEQPVDGIAGEIPIGRRLDLEVAQEQGIADDDHASRTALRDDILDARLSRRRPSAGKAAFWARSPAAVALGPEKAISSTRGASAASARSFNWPTDRGRAQVKSPTAEQGIDDGMLAIAKTADDDIRPLDRCYPDP